MKNAAHTVMAGDTSLLSPRVVRAAHPSLSPTRSHAVGRLFRRTLLTLKYAESDMGEYGIDDDPVEEASLRGRRMGWIEAWQHAGQTLQS